MGKLIIVIFIVIIAFWMGRQSVSSKKSKISGNEKIDESKIIDIEIEDKSLK